MKLTLSHYILFLLCLVLPFSSGCARERCPGGLDRSVQRLRQNAERGCAEAQAILAQFALRIDNDKAFMWYSKSAEQGHPWGQHGLGVCYSFGFGVPRDEEVATKWFRKAAEQGLASSQHALGQAYLRGYGVPKDEAEAAKWFHKAREQRDRDAAERFQRIMGRN